MNGTPYQPAPAGVWRSSPERILLWAVTGALQQVQRDIPETKSRTRWESKLEKAILDPVRKYAWQKVWTAKAVRKDDSSPDVPAQVTDAWAKIPDLIASDLWMSAAQERTDRLNLPFNAEDFKKGMDATMHLVSSIPDTLHDRLREIMRQAYDEQKGQFSFARAIRSEFAGVSTTKATQIAVTEWNRAASTATLEGYKAQGVAKKMWLTAGDERVCPACETNGADGEIPIDSAFFSGDEAPPAHPGCRCDIAAA